MSTVIRKATISDAEAFVRIKGQLSMGAVEGSTSRGGFLLGSDTGTYRYYIENAYTLVAEVNGRVVGFGIVLPDALLRGSEVWIKRYEAQWDIDLARYEDKKLCYFEQLAFLPGYSRWAVVLAYNISRWVFDMGGQAIFTTVVTKPVRNLASIPFIKLAGGEKAGTIKESYPEAGEIGSDIYLIDAASYYPQIAKHPLYPFFSSHMVKL